MLSQSGYLVFQYQLGRVNRSMETRLENKDYEDKYLLEVKVPLNMPYYLDQNDYQAVTGEVNIRGIIYNYVKSKIKSDTLYLLCLRNDLKTKVLGLDLNRLGESFSTSKDEKNTQFTVSIMGKGTERVVSYLLDSSPIISKNVSPSHLPSFVLWKERIPLPPYIGITVAPPELLNS